MKLRIKIGLLTLSLLSIFSINLQAQTSEDPVKWEVKVIPKDEKGLYELRAQAKIAEGFHIWALNAGGDGSLINTEVEMDEKHKYIWVEDEWQVNKKPTPVDLDYIDGTLYWYESEVTLYRTIDSDVSMTVEGSIIFQVCNEQYCYPPETYEFKNMIPIR